MHRYSVLALLAAAAPAAVAQTSTFDSDAEGWSYFSDARDFAWSATLGNPPGAIVAVDVAAGDIWFFSASPAYLGDRSAAYGGVLSWEILGITGNQTTAASGADVILAGGGQMIGVETTLQPVRGAWRSMEITLDTATSWRFVTSPADGTLSGTPVGEAVIRAVLADLTGLYIRGEYTHGADSAALDNVVLTVPCFADRDGDGEATVQDLLDFLGAFRQGGASADATGDGSVTVDDLLAYLGAFRAGC